MRKTNQRIESIDILRGIVILVMLFVNSIAGVTGTPNWMKHAELGVDALPYADVVFPAFLFIVGISIPIAIENRFSKGEKASTIFRHILIRTVSLIIIGLYMVNTYTASKSGVISDHLWNFLMFVAVFLIWQKSTIITQKLKRILQYVSFAVLIILFFIYRNDNVDTFIQMRVQWWGILALIGWAYIIGCAVYFFLRKNLNGILGMMFLSYFFAFLLINNTYPVINEVIPWFQMHIVFGSQPAIVISGIFIGVLFLKSATPTTDIQKIKIGFYYGLGLILAGYMLHELTPINKMFSCNKILSTPTWGLYSSGITVWLWVLVYWIVDVKKIQRWALYFKPAGVNALFVYILAPLIIHFLGVVGDLINYDFYDKLAESFTTGLIRAIVFIILIMGLAILLKKKGISMKL